MADVGMKEDHRKLLQKYRVVLVKDLEPARILNHLGEILDNDDRDEILTCRTRMDKAERLLDLLPRKGPDAFECFVRTLKKKQKHLGDLLLKESGLCLSEESNVDDHGMSGQHREILRHSTASLRDMNLEKILPLLFNCLDREERDGILGIETRSGRVDKLLVEVLPRKGPMAFEHFIRVLEQVHPDFAKPLMKEARMEPSQCTARRDELPYPVEHNETSHVDDVDKGVDCLTGKMTGLEIEVFNGSKTPRFLGDLGAQNTLWIAEEIEAGDSCALIAKLQAELGCDSKGSTLEIIQKFHIRKFTQLLKDYKRYDVIKQMRKMLLAGTTGPVLDESKYVRDIPYSVRKELTRELCADDRWKSVAEQLKLTPVDIRYLDRNSVKNPADEVFRHWEVKANSTVGHLYDVLVKLEYPIIADLL